MQMDRGLDTGPQYCMYEHVITEAERADELEMNLGKLGANNVIDALSKIADGTFHPIPQDDEASTYTGKIKKSDGKVDWCRPAQEVIAKMRAFHPWPGISFTVARPKGELTVRIEDAEIVDRPGAPGEVLVADKKEWIVACGSQALRLTQVVPQGKKVMGGADFLRGCQIEAGTILPTPDPT